MRETKANMFFSEYEAFHMKNNESISKMYARLTLITNDLKSLGKTYSEYELIRKFLDHSLLYGTLKQLSLRSLRIYLV